MNKLTVITGLKNCSGSGENCHCPYSDIAAGSCVSALCRDALMLIDELMKGHSKSNALCAMLETDRNNQRPV